MGNIHTVGPNEALIVSGEIEVEIFVKFAIKIKKNSFRMATGFVAGGGSGRCHVGSSAAALFYVVDWP